MRLTLLGTGNAAGMPLYGCNCVRCIEVQETTALRRGPAHALLEVANKRYLIDAGMMDIADRFPAGTLDGIFVTHFHPDHVQGLFHLRWGIGDKIPVYHPTDNEGCADLYKHAGILDFQVQKKYEAFELGGVKITPLPLIHSKPTIGYLFEYKSQRVAYLVDTKGIPSRAEELLNNGNQLDALVVDTYFQPGIENQNHNNLDDTLALHKVIGPKKTVMTHIGHDFDVWLTTHSNTLPDDVVPGHDGYVAFP